MGLVVELGGLAAVELDDTDPFGCSAVEGDDVVLSWRGACKSCPSRADTMQGALEPELRGALPWLKAVRSESR